MSNIANIGNIETNIDCGTQKIKIKNITSKDPTNCSVSKIGNKINELCDGKKSCKVINNMLDCPGIDIGITYGCMDDIGADITGSINIKNITTPGDIDISSSIKTNIQSSINQENLEQFINDSMKNSISYKFNNMEYNQSSENIQYRAEKLISGNQTYDDNKSETSVINIVKNQEDKPTTVNMSESQPASEMKLYTMDSKMDAGHANIEQLLSETSQSQNPVIAFIDKYKFWIIVGLVVIVLLFISIAYFYGSSGTKTKSTPTTSGGSASYQMSEIGISPPSDYVMPELPKFIQDIKNAAKPQNIGNNNLSSSPLITDIQLSASTGNA
ncbi:hypothetical protein QKU48_gp0791 [Fadolivirus algeromassiliense]|jgi:hypothetical protein|uniref:Uncharacterized protein n=1 Tax=Fadolivirus FV1/VV64 TaxID=3070911 RepID=A0A7D3UVL0_9VIRU|nr:hypothetical protein QKU48_gp0791 [Fadolivirus algeromassiliense]QKF94249.1 hypothetical protein Fadolivirus_1_791 [Fadolivirus FV1/VV64]